MNRQTTGQGWSRLALLVGLALAAAAAEVGLAAGEEGPPRPPPELVRTPPRLPPVQGIEGALAQAWGFRAPQKVDNTGTQYQNEKRMRFEGSGSIVLSLATAEPQPTPDGAAAAEAAQQVVATIGFGGQLTPVIQTRQRYADGGWQRYALGVYFADLDQFDEKIAVSTLPQGGRRIQRKGKDVLVLEGETVMVDSAAGVQVEQAYETLGLTQGVCVMEQPMLGAEQAVSAPRIPETRERPCEVLGGLGPLLTMRLPADAQGAVDPTAGRSWRSELELGTVGGAPMKRTHAMPVQFRTVGAEARPEAADAILFQGSYVFALGEDEFRGAPELLYALGDLLRQSDLTQCSLKGAIGRGEIKLWYSPALKAMVAGQWTETLTRLNLQTGRHAGVSLSGTQTANFHLVAAPAERRAQ